MGRGSPRKVCLDDRDKAILAKFPEGTVVESTIGLGGPSEVFIEYYYVQPFSYLDDYNLEHYKVYNKK